jgi:hypothetical protein
MFPSSSSPLIASTCLLLAMVFGALSTLIVIEVRRKSRQKARIARIGRPSVPYGAEELNRRKGLVDQLIGLYSGVHSISALSDFLNAELERRHEPWRVRIPEDGPGEILDLSAD